MKEPNYFKYSPDGSSVVINNKRGHEVFLTTLLILMFCLVFSLYNPNWSPIVFLIGILLCFLMRTGLRIIQIDLPSNELKESYRIFLKKRNKIRNLSDFSVLRLYQIEGGDEADYYSLHLQERVRESKNDVRLLISGNEEAAISRAEKLADFISIPFSYQTKHNKAVERNAEIAPLTRHPSR